MPNLADFLNQISEADLLRQIVRLFQAGNRAALAHLQKEVGIEDCGCKVKIIRPLCEKHRTWRTWNKEEKTPAWQIAAQWQWQTRQRTSASEVEEFLEIKSRYCPCPVLFVPCKHQFSLANTKGFGVPFSVHILLRYLLWPDKYQEPPLDSRPSKVMDRTLKVLDFIRRYADNVQIFHPEDLLTRDLIIEAIERMVSRKGRGGMPVAGQVIQ